MIRKTQRKPVLFERKEDRFRSTRLGHLTAAELLAEYLPLIMDLQHQFENTDTEEETEEGEVKINLSKILKDIPKGTIQAIFEDFMTKTEVMDENGDWEALDPENFESFEESCFVIFEVFKINYPDFFQTGEGTEDTPDPVHKKQMSSPRTTQKKNQINL